MTSDLTTDTARDNALTRVGEALRPSYGKLILRYGTVSDEVALLRSATADTRAVTLCTIH